MHVGTYPTRNFATLGPSELRPPFTGPSISSVNLSCSVSSTGQVSDPIRRVTTLQSPVFLVNSRYPRYCATILFKWSSIFQRYGGNLPSSFNILISSPECTYTNSPVLVWGTVIYNKYAISWRILLIR